MKREIIIQINGNPFKAKQGEVLAAALARAGVRQFKASPEGHARAPLCGMGICFECAVTVNGVPHCKSCQTLCEVGMTVETGHA